MYDSTQDTLAHINRVRGLLEVIAEALILRSLRHDTSKLVEPEKSVIDEYTPKMKEMEYNSDEYNECLSSMSEILNHHYAHNSHHPEFFKNGINGMNLIDLIEMFCDWFAASQRNKNGSIYKSLEIGRKRFGVSDQLYDILKNTISLFGGEQLD